MESLAADLNTLVRTPLHDSHVARLRSAGVERVYAAGAFVARPGDAMDTFLYVVDGEIETLDPRTMERRVQATAGPTQFLGEIGFLMGGRWSLYARAVRDTHTIEVDRDTMLGLMAEIPEMSDIVITVFAARRRRLVELGFSGLTLIGAESDRAVSAIAAFANRNRIPVTSLGADTQEAEAMRRVCGLQPGQTGVVFGTDEVIAEPSLRAVAAKLGLDMGVGERKLFDLVVVGGGPAGIAAAVYAGAEGLEALVLEDLTIGGQAGASSRIENYMGFPTGISGADLCWRGEIQAMKFGTRFAMPRRVAGLAREGEVFRVALEDGDALHARSVLVATGVQYRRLPLARLAEFEGAGIYYAATDAEARFCQDTEAVVIGGGNSAGQAAMFLSRFARHVHVLIRGPSLAASMSEYLASRLRADPAITLHYTTHVTALHGTEALSAVNVRDTAGGADWQIDTRALFVMAGAAPHTDWLSGLVGLDEKGFVKTGPAVGAASTYATSEPGIFAVGDVRAGSVKRVASAVGEGSVVISNIWDYVRG